VRPLLAELTRANLLTEYVSNRYTCHDLLRAYATEQTCHLDSDTERDAATRRLLDHYVHTAHAAAVRLHPARPPIPLPLGSPAQGSNPEHLAGHAQAMAWLTAEDPTLLAALRLAADSGFDTHCWHLAWALEDFLRRQGRWHDLAAAWQAALDAADRLGHPVAQANAHRNLAYAHGRLGRYPEAHAQYRTALDLNDGSDPGELAQVHQNLALLWGQQARFDRALDHAQQALALYLRAGSRSGQAYALNSAGWYHAQLGDHERALAHCEQALALFQRAGDHHGQAAVWDSLGYAHHHIGHHAQAVTCYRRALDLYRDLGDRYNEADTLSSLGDVHHTAGNRTHARTAWQQALDILTDLDHPDAAQVRARLRRAEHTTTNRQPRADARAARP
jgi:tetratricopeptide (TPR) repeat protein